MQRCPYIHEMRERLLGQPQESMAMDTMERDGLIDNRQSAELNQVGTVVKTVESCKEELNQKANISIKLHADGYHTSPTHQRTPLVPRDLGEDFNLDFDDDQPLDYRKPKNANDPHILSSNALELQEPQPKRTSLFIVTSLVYAMLLIVVCIAYVISDVTTHRLPVLYYEGFFTYLYGASILFLLYVFCFLLQESTCCSGNKPKPPPKEKKPKKQKPKKGEPAESKDAGKGGKDSGKGGKPSPFQERLPKKKRDLVREKMLLKDTTAEAEAAATPKNVRKRKTTLNEQSHGSFFLRVGAIAFGLGAMIYVGLEFGSFFEIPFTSRCHHILNGVNPLLQMIFTFMQMYFIFMNSRLNIHRFKVLARFGLMHVVATNICVWIRTLVKESLHEITIYHQKRGADPEDSFILDSIRRHTLRHAGQVMKTHLEPHPDIETFDTPKLGHDENILSKMVRSTVEGVTNRINNLDEFLDPRRLATTSSTTTTTASPYVFRSTSTTEEPSSTPFYLASTTMMRKLKKFITSTAATTTTSSTTTTSPLSTSTLYRPVEDETVAASTFAPLNSLSSLFSGFSSSPAAQTVQSIPDNLFSGLENSYQTLSEISHSEIEPYESLDNIYPAALSSAVGTLNSTICGRVDIMGTIVYDSAPYLYPFIIEYSLVGAVVIYVMWKHIGRNPRFMNEEDLEHRLEVMLSRRAVAMAQQARTGRVDCVGSSKGLFFGLLLLVGSLICLILFFVLVRHPQFSLLAIYLADVSHCVLMAFAVFAIIIGFIRVKSLKFRCEEQSNLNDILLRISAFGLFVYSVFSVIAGSLKALESEPNLLVTTTGILAVFQVVFQLLFIADVSRRRVHLPEHDRSKPGRQIVTFLLICNVSMFAIYTFEAQKVFANPVQLDFYGFVPWSIIQRVTLPLCIFHRFHSAVTLAEIWKTTYKARLE
ncbi:proton channel OtopLc isoform X3 [Hermetia illucens]|uniref:proton channel OtopLc isoform X3 n=1 Tax=Hermetia illucens TaxID=343691 RepID=UPI0018CC5990|nr:proton channel OtopLc isoform X3 [Hermetia illucens]